MRGILRSWLMAQINKGIEWTLHALSCTQITFNDILPSFYSFLLNQP